jgi:hypothetical protein
MENMAGVKCLNLAASIERYRDSMEHGLAEDVEALAAVSCAVASATARRSVGELIDPIAGRWETVE